MKAPPATVLSDNLFNIEGNAEGGLAFGSKSRLVINILIPALSLLGSPPQAMLRKP
jgi:hypothetical protein